MPSDKGLITLDEVKEAKKVLDCSALGVCRTPLIKNDSFFPGLQDLNLYLKLENMQTTGSFKIRGVANQMAHIPEEIEHKKKKFVTISAGNYGKAFAYALNKLGLPGICIMPLTAPCSRVQLIKSYGIEVQQVPSFDLMTEVNRQVTENGAIFLHPFDDLSLISGYGSYGCQVEAVLSSEIEAKFKYYMRTNGSQFCHPFDDLALIAGYGSASLEILEDGVRPDVVIVCCGGGGLVSGVAATLKLSGLTDCRIYAVEPKGSPTMYESFKKGEAVTIPTVKSVAAGLSPPFAGEITYQHCKEYVEDVVLVTDEELVNTMGMFYERGLVVEPSGCAAMAALINGHIPDVKGRNVVVFVTGGNVTLDEMKTLIK